MAKNRSALLSIYNQKYIIRILAPELRQNNIKNILKQFNERPTSDENDYYQVLLWKIKKTIRGKLSFSQRFLIDAGKGDEGGIFSETEILKSSGVVP
ncbi:hypothetical protein [Piscirickettsia salmonis]|nr:hypothetical protein [Piscirickettsia salmonis]